MGSRIGTYNIAVPHRISDSYGAGGEDIEPPFESAIRIVGAGSRANKELINQGTTKTAFNSRVPFVLGGPVRKLIVPFDGWYINGDLESDIPATINLTKVAIECNGVTVPVTFSGGRPLAIAAGSHTLSDELNVAAFGFGDYLPRDTLIWVRLYGTVSNGTTGRIPTGATLTGYIDGARFAYFAPGGGVDRTDLTGPLPVQTGETPLCLGFAPPMLLGRWAGFYGDRGISALGVGSSIIEGIHDWGCTKTGTGYFMRAAQDFNGQNAIGAALIAGAGATLPGSFPQFIKRAEYLQYCTHFFNTLQPVTNSADTPALIEQRLRDWCDFLRDADVQVIIFTYQRPFTNTIDRWLTSAGQTPNGASSAPGAITEQSWAIVDALVEDGTVDRAVTISAFRDPVTPTKYRTDGYTPNWMTHDGIHFSGHAHRMLSVEAREALVPSGYDIEPETTALLARFSVQPTAWQKTAINTAIKELKDAKLWDKFDAFYVALTDEQQSQQNWVQNAFNLTKVGTPEFLPGVGYNNRAQGVGQRLGTGFNPTTAPSPKFTQNSAHLSAATRFDCRVSSMIGRAAVSGVAAFVPVEAIDGTVSLAMNSTVADTVPVDPLGAGIRTTTRTSVSAVALHHNGKKVATTSRASTGLTNLTFQVLGANGDLVEFPADIPHASIGAGLTDAEVALKDQIVAKLLAGLGICFPIAPMKATSCGTFSANGPVSEFVLPGIAFPNPGKDRWAVVIARIHFEHANPRTISRITAAGFGGLGDLSREIMSSNAMVVDGTLSARIAWWWMPLSAEALGDVIVSCSGSTAFCRIAVYEIEGFLALTDFKQAIDLSTVASDFVSVSMATKPTRASRIVGFTAKSNVANNLVASGIVEDGSGLTPPNYIARWGRNNDPSSPAQVVTATTGVVAATHLAMGATFI